MLSCVARRAATVTSAAANRRTFATTAEGPVRLVRRKVSLEERAALRAARKERANQMLAAQGGGGGTAAAAAAAASSGTARSFPAAPRISASSSRWIWYASVLGPTGLIAWALNDENSPPAKLSEAIGLTGLIQGYTDDFAKPSHEKLLPDWSEMPNVPPDIPVPHTLVLDLEKTLVSSTWDRKYGWRHAKRPGVDKFLQTLAQYYEIVLYSPSIEGIADPVVSSLDKSGCIMHRLYREATHYKNGIHMKDLNKLNRNVNRMILLDDDPLEAGLNPENLIRVKPYEDPTDRSDRTLERITPFLIEIARKGYSDVPAILRQYQGMDADEIAEEYERRIQQFIHTREQRAQRGLGGLANRGRNLPAPELPPATDDIAAAGAPQQLTSKDLVGAAPTPQQTGMMGWLNKRAQDKEEQQMRKMEKWNEIILRKQQQKKEAEAAAAKAR